MFLQSTVTIHCYNKISMYDNFIEPNSEFPKCLENILYSCFIWTFFQSWIPSRLETSLACLVSLAPDLEWILSTSTPTLPIFSFMTLIVLKRQPSCHVECLSIWVHLIVSSWLDLGGTFWATTLQRWGRVLPSMLCKDGVTPVVLSSVMLNVDLCTVKLIFHFVNN